MTEAALTESDIARALVGFGSIFPPRRFVCVENVSWGLGLPWEADLVAMSSNGYLHEVEIKISVSDLKRDLQKQKHALIAQDLERPIKRGHSSWMRRFSYAMPVEVWEKAGDRLLALPAGAGVITCAFVQPPPGMKARLRCVVAVPAQTNKNAIPLELRDRYRLARLGVLRYWDRLAA